MSEGIPPAEPKTAHVEVHIEPVKATELEELADLASRSFSDAFGHAMSEEDLKASLDEKRSVGYFERALKTDMILVAKQGGNIVGYVQYGDVSTPGVESKEGDKELARIYVDTSLQGQGIGRQLMDTALADPTMSQAPNIYLVVWEHNADAIGMYHGYGFKEAARIDTALPDASEDLIMVREQIPPTPSTLIPDSN